jgi:hypothetical protein
MFDPTSTLEVFGPISLGLCTEESYLVVLLRGRGVGVGCVS